MEPESGIKPLSSSKNRGGLPIDQLNVRLDFGVPLTTTLDNRGVAASDESDGVDACMSRSTWMSSTSLYVETKETVVNYIGCELQCSKWL